MAEAYMIEEPAYIEEVIPSVIVEPSSNAAPDNAADISEVLAVAAAGGPLPAAAIKFANVAESGSESGDDAAEPGTSKAAETNTGRSSPPPNCAICLSRCKRKCFTDSCLHQFCFKCLCEWSKIKAECPLCKQPFKTIIHNVRTLNDYDRYSVQNDTTPPERRMHFVNIRRNRLQNQAVMTSANDIDAAGESEDGIPTVEPSLFMAPAHRFEPYRTELLNYYRDDQGSGFQSSLSQLWRRYVYDRKLYALPVSDSLTGHFRQWSARFYRDNPAQMHRLMPFINRDIVCLLRNSPHNVSTVMHLINDILPMTNILGPAFRRRLTPFLGERTSHFIHELFNFARSPYDMIGYDRVVQYSARLAEEVEVDLLDMVSPLSSTEGETEGEPPSNTAESSNDWPAITPSRTPRPSSSVIVTNPSATHSFSVTVASDGSELPGIAIRRTTTSNVGSQTVAINLSMRRPDEGEVIEIDDGDAAANAEVAAINDNSNGSQGRRNAGASFPVSAHIELQSSDSAGTTDDECVFVLERKAPHLRTPELVSLDSGSDSDVVFVDEQRPSNTAAAMTADAARADEATNQDPMLASNELFMGPSTSTGVCSNSGKNWKKVLEEARRQDRISRSTRQRRLSRRAAYATYHCFIAAPTQTASSSACSSSDSTSPSSSSSSSSESYSDVEKNKRKGRLARRISTRKRATRSKAQQPPAKRSRRQIQHNDDAEQSEVDSSSDSSESSSTSDSTANIQLSALRAALKAANDSNDGSQNPKLATENCTPETDTDDAPLSPFAGELLSRELANDASQDQKHPIENCSAETDTDDAPLSPFAEALLSRELTKGRSKRRSTNCFDPNLSSQSSLATSVSLGSSSSSALSIFNTDANDANDPLVHGSVASPNLPTSETMDQLVHSAIEFSDAGQQRVFDRSAGVEDDISFLRNALPNSANSLDYGTNLAIFSNESNEMPKYQGQATSDAVSNTQSQRTNELDSCASAAPVTATLPCAADDTAAATEDNEDNDVEQKHEAEHEDTASVEPHVRDAEELTIYEHNEDDVAGTSTPHVDVNAAVDAESDDDGDGDADADVAPHDEAEVDGDVNVNADGNTSAGAEAEGEADVDVDGDDDVETHAVDANTNAAASAGNDGSSKLLNFFDYYSF